MMSEQCRGSFHVRREFWPSCNVETSPGIRCRRLEWWRAACTAHTRGCFSWHEGALRLVCNVGAPRRHQRWVHGWQKRSRWRERSCLCFASICPLVTRPRDVSPSLGDGQVRVRYSCLASWKHGGLDRDGEHADICTEDGVSSILVSLIALQIGVQCSVKRSRDDSCIYSFDKNELCMNGGNSIEKNQFTRFVSRRFDWLKKSICISLRSFILVTKHLVGH